MRLLFKHGFEAMNLRQLAADSGLKSGSLYNYFDSKSQFLAMILCDTMETILADLDKTVAPIEETRARLHKFIQFRQKSIRILLIRFMASKWAARLS